MPLYVKLKERSRKKLITLFQVMCSSNQYEVKLLASLGFNNTCGWSKSCLLMVIPLIAF